MKRTPRWVFVVLLLLITLWAYRGLRFGAFHDDLFDYQQFLEQRIQASSESEFFWRVISFDRVRTYDAKVNFLFRPGLFTLLAVEDIYSRESPPVSGWISLFLHCLCVITLFAMLSRFAPPLLAFILSAVFAVYSQGSFMILWRMIVPYTIALLAFVAGTWLLFMSDWGSPKKRAVGAGFLFLFSSFFNEPAAFWIPIAGLLSWRLSREENLPRWDVFAFLFPPTVFFSLSLIDLFWRAPAGGLFSNYFAPFSSGATPFYFAFLSVVRFLQSIGYYTLPFFIPQGATLSVDDSQIVHLLLGALLLVFAGWTLKKNLPRLRKVHRPALFWVVLLGYPLSIILMVGIFRVTTLGYAYLGASSYYCYTVGFFLFLVTGVLLAPLFPSSWRGRPPGWLALILILMMNQALFSYGRLQKNIWRLVPAQRERAQLLARAVSFLGEDKCLVWSPKYLRARTPLAPIYLYRRSCEVRKGAPVSLYELKCALKIP